MQENNGEAAPASDWCSDAVQTPPQRDAAILLSFPGIGRLNLATLLTEAFKSPGTHYNPEFAAKKTIQ